MSILVILPLNCSPKGVWETLIIYGTPYCEGVFSEEVVWTHHIELLAGIVTDDPGLLTTST